MLVAAGKLVGFFHRQPQPEDDQRPDGPDRKGNPPTKGGELGVGVKLLQDNLHQQGQQLPGNQGDVLKRGVKAAPVGTGHFRQVGSRGAVFSTEREALEQAGEDQNEG